MLVDELFEKNVGYFVAEIWNQDLHDHERLPVGTVFFVQKSIGDQFGSEDYAVTCRHVIEGAKSLPFRALYIRVNNFHSAGEDIPSQIDDWVFSDHTDVAIARVNFPPKIKFWANPLQGGVGHVYPGHDVFVVGLFSALPGFSAVEAIVRCGKVARPSTTVGIRLDPNSEDITTVDAHLIETRSWGGESGSPVFIYDEQIHVPGSSVYDPGYPLYATTRPNRMTASQAFPGLFGILHGHFEISAAVKSGGTEIGGVDVNSGIGIVIPTRDIEATLMNGRLVEDRERTLAERRKHAGPTTSF